MISPSHVSDDQAIIHAAHKKARDFWSFALRQTTISEKRLGRYEECGKRAWIYYSESRKRHKVKHESCGLRVCPLCSQKYQERSRKRIDSLFGQTQLAAMKFITLTIKHTNDRLILQLRRLQQAFRKLRQRAIWRKVKWGAAVIEIKRNPKTGEWHPHLHILAVADYIPQATLSDAWLDITGDSRIVDIRAVKDRKGAVNEIAKYASKPTSFKDLGGSLPAGAQLYEAIDGRRLLLLFGGWPKELDQKPEREKEENDWKVVMRLSDCLAKANAGDVEAIRILNDCQIPPRTLEQWIRATPHPT